MIEVAVDVNFVLDACRFRSTYAEALDRPNDRMHLLHLVKGLGRRAGVVLHTGPHVLSNLRNALAKPELSKHGVTREAWCKQDIDDLVDLFLEAVAASGGRCDVETISHDRALGTFEAAGAPDAEDLQMLCLAVNSGATVLATKDQDLLKMGEYRGVEIWSSDEIQGEVRATLRALQRR